MELPYAEGEVLSLDRGGRVRLVQEGGSSSSSGPAAMSDDDEEKGRETVNERDDQLQETEGAPISLASVIVIAGLARQGLSKGVQRE